MAEAAGQQRRPRAGRPRLRPAADDGLSPREEILDAAAALFVTQGIAATSTRQIAERVGVRQASLYYYFGGKEEILLELLTQSVRPSLEMARFLESGSGGDPAAGLYALALTDVRTLARAPHNVGMLYLSPEVQGAAFDSFRTERAALQDIYGRLGVMAAAAHVTGADAGDAGDAGRDAALTGTLIMQLVESVIQLRRTGSLPGGYGHAIAAACLRLVGLTDAEAARARDAAGRAVRHP